MKSFEMPPTPSNKDPEYDDYLETLWNRYGFSGNPPILNSDAEKRLKEKCERYSRFIIDTKNKASYSDPTRRQLHNEIAIMTVGKQRSGMGSEEARHVANFALVFIHGLTVDDIESGKFDDTLYK